MKTSRSDRGVRDEPLIASRWRPACASRAALLRRAAPRQRRRTGTLTIAVIPKGTSHVFWQSIHAGADKAAQGARRRRSSGAARCARTIATRRSPKSKASSAAACPDRAGAARRGGARAAGGRRDAPQDPGRRHRLGAEGRRLRQLRRDRQPQGRPPGGEHLAALLHGKGKVVMLRYAEGSDSTGKREAGFPRGDRRAQGHRGRQREPVRRRRRRRRVQEERGAAQPLQEARRHARRRRHLHPNESTTLRDAARARRQRLGGQGEVRRLRRVRHAGQGARATAHIDGLVLQDPVNMGYLGVKTMVAHLKGQPVEKRIDTGVQLVTRDHMNDPDDQGAAASRSVAMAEAAEPRRASRCAACARRSAPPSRSTASISPSRPARSARWSDRTAPARAR